MTPKEVKEASNSNNVKAFLQMLRWAEGTPGENGYQTLFGKSLFSNLSDHPYLAGEWKGVKLSDTHCKGAGLKPGCITTAAGAYQFIAPTWKYIKNKLSLPDFYPENQDKAAIWLLGNCGALPYIEKGDFENAVKKASGIWASLSFSTAGQPTKKLAELQNKYVNNGGTIA